MTPLMRRGGLPAAVHLVDQFAQAQRRGVEGQALGGDVAQVEGGVHHAAHAAGRLGDAADAGLGVRRQPLARKLFGQREDAVHLLTDVGGDAVEEERGQGHEQPKVAGRDGCTHGAKRLRRG